jgi:hypothetical protein
MMEYPGGEFAAYLTAAEFDPLLTFVSNGCKSGGVPAQQSSQPTSNTPARP